MAVRITPSNYFEEENNQQSRNYIPLIIFGSICVVAIAAMLMAYLKK